MFQIKKDETSLMRAHSRDFLASIVALICSILWLYASNYKLITRFLQFIRASSDWRRGRLGFSFTLPAPRPNTFTARFRQESPCWLVESFSQSERHREIVLRYFIVYDFQGKQLFSRPEFLARKAVYLDIEFPYSAPITIPNEPQPVYNGPTVRPLSELRRKAAQFGTSQIQRARGTAHPSLPPAPAPGAPSPAAVTTWQSVSHQ